MRRITLLFLITISLISCQSRFDELQIQIDEQQKQRMQLLAEQEKNLSDLKMGLISANYFDNLMDEINSKQNDINYEIKLMQYEQKYEQDRYTSKEYNKIKSLLRYKEKLKMKGKLINSEINLVKAHGDNPKELLSQRDSIDKLISETTRKINSYNIITH